MVEAIGILTATFVVVLLIAVVTGRAKVSTCCRYVPPGEDPRLTDAPRVDRRELSA